MDNDVVYPTRWFLNGIRSEVTKDYWDWPLLEGRVLSNPGSLYTDISENGVSLDLTYAVFDIPVVNRKTNALILEHYSDYVQSFPIAIRGRSEEFFVINF